MTVHVLRERILNFLRNERSEVLCIKGKWGVGKTYIWKSILSDVSETEGGIALDRYSYVSLFGINNLDDLKRAIFENTVPKKKIKEGPSEATIIERLKSMEGFGRATLSFIMQSSFLQSYLGGFEKLFFTIKKQIICIDDLERRGETLKLKDVLGLISFLKEEKECKIIILFNELELEDTDKASYKEMEEKIADSEFVFQPTAKEAADIVFANPSGITEMLHRNCTLLGITNIRVIKKIETLALQLNSLLKDEDQGLISQAMNTVVLFGWSRFQPAEAPPVSFLTDTSKLHGLKKDKDKITDQEQGWQTLIRAYGYVLTDEFDIAINEGIQAGYFDPEQIGAAINKISNKRQKDQFSKAWDLYHDSFKHDEKTVLDAIYSAAIENIEALSPMDLNSTVSFLKEFDRSKEAQVLIKKFLDVHPADKDTYDVNRVFWASDKKDPDVIDAFSKKRAEVLDSRNPADVLDSIATNSGWNPEDIELLSNITSDKFYNLFKAAEGRRAHALIRGALIFKTLRDSSEQMREISARAVVALKKIGKESRINARRVRAQGIAVDD